MTPFITYKIMCVTPAFRKASQFDSAKFIIPVKLGPENYQAQGILYEMPLKKTRITPQKILSFTF